MERGTAFPADGETLEVVEQGNGALSWSAPMAGGGRDADDQTVLAARPQPVDR